MLPSARRPILTGFVTIAALAGGLFGWGMLVTLSGAIIAPGRIEVDRNRQVVQHPDGGVVTEIAVREGDTVAAGDLLIRLDGAALRSELTVVEERLFALYAARGRLEAERDCRLVISFPLELVAAAETRPDLEEMIADQSRLFEARRDTRMQQNAQLERRIDQIASQTAGIDAQIAAQSSQIALLSTELDRQQALYGRGLAKVDRVLALQRETARIGGVRGELLANRAQAEERRIEITLQQLALGSKEREDALSDLRDEAADEAETAERRRALRERVARLDVRAPVAGVVLGLQVFSPRSVIRAAEPVLYLIPQDRPLVITAQISPLQIDEVRRGQAVLLRFPGLAARTTPELSGHVTLLSADAMHDDAAKSSYYRADVELDPGEAGKLGGDVLRPGMPVEAFFRTRDRTPFSYLLAPFTAYFGRAFRET